MEHEKIHERLDKIENGLILIEKRIAALTTETDNYLTVREICDHYRMSRTKFNDLRKKGLIKVYKMKGKLLIKKSEMDEFIKSMVSIAPQRA